MRQPNYVTHGIGHDGAKRRKEFCAATLRQAQAVAAREFDGFQTVQTRDIDDPMVPVIDAKWTRER